MKEIIITLNDGKTKVYVFLDEKGSGLVQSTLMDYIGNKELTDIVESLILAHAINGIDVASKAYTDGIETYLEAWANHN